MEKQKIKNHTLIFQATYHAIEAALYQGINCVEKITIPKQQASSLLMQSILDLLKKHSLQWSDIAFLGANQGPAPFTTLRALITTLNGIAFATKVPLIGIDGLEAFVTEQHKDTVTVVLLNAFAGDLYFAIQDGSEIKKGWAPAEDYLPKLEEQLKNKEVTFVGNGVEKHQTLIRELFGNKAILKGTEFVSLDSIAQICFENKNLKKETALKPLYLKTQQFKKAS